MTALAATNPWEEIYASGHENRWPWDCVVSFIFRHRPQHLSRENTQILEVGCGTGNNLWFAAREGFRTTGVDWSPTALGKAHARFTADGLGGEWVEGLLHTLTFPDASFHLVIDRSALTCLGTDELRQAIREVHRVLVPGGKFLFTPYSQGHTSEASGTLEADGRIHGICKGSLVGAGPLRFFKAAELADFFGPGWNILSAEQVQATDITHTPASVHADWRIVAEKTGE